MSKLADLARKIRRPRPVTGYALGGYIAPIRGQSPWLAADECIVNGKDVQAGRWVCIRPGHPTPTSDCARRQNQRA